MVTISPGIRSVAKKKCSGWDTLESNDPLREMVMCPERGI